MHTSEGLTGHLMGFWIGLLQFLPTIEFIEFGWLVHQAR